MITAPLVSSNEMNFDKNESFNIICNEKEIKLTIAFNEKIIFFEVEEKDIFPKEEYTLYKSLEELIKIDKFFRQFDKIEEVFDSIENIISKGNLSIIKEENSMLIKMDANKEIIIRIPVKEKDIKINNLIDYINYLSNKNKKLEKEINDMKNDFEKRFEDLELKFEKRLKDLELKNQNEINKINKRDMFKNSKIVNRNEIDLILSWFEKRPTSFNLLLDANIDENFLNSFFIKCLDKYPTIIFVKTTNNIKFGGFTNVDWPKKGRIKDENSFVFSLSKRQKYQNMIKSNDVIEVTSNYLSFGCGYDLYLCNRLKSEGGGTYKCFYNIPGNYDLSGGYKKFKLLNCEIYQVIY